MEIKIYYDDTDAGGVVYHANYLKYFERGRTEYMRQRGIDPAAMAQSGLIFVIVRAEVSYLSPARYGDTITVETFIDEISHASVIFGYKIYLSGPPEADLPKAQGSKKGLHPSSDEKIASDKSSKVNNKLVVTGKTKIAMVSKDMKVQRFSDDFIKRFKAV